MTQAPQKMAIISGSGSLPRLLLDNCRRRAQDCVLVSFQDAPGDVDPPGPPLIRAGFERLGALFDALKEARVSAVVFAGGMTRPRLDPAKFDEKTRQIAPRLFSQMGQGDDALLRQVAAVFEAEGFSVLAPHQLCPDLLAPRGVLGTHEPQQADRADISRAQALAQALGALDVGQGAVVAQGLCLGLETLQGTDRLLEFVARTAAGLRPDPQGGGGVLYKGPKPGQDLRMDMPTIGPPTVENAARAGLAGIAVAAGAVLILERDRTIQAADRLGLFLFGA